MKKIILKFLDKRAVVILIKIHLLQKNQKAFEMIEFVSEK